MTRGPGQSQTNPSQKQFCLELNLLGSTYALCTFLFCFQWSCFRDGEWVRPTTSTSTSSTSSNHKKRCPRTPRSTSSSHSPAILYMEQSRPAQTFRGYQPDVCVCEARQLIKWKVSLSSVQDRLSHMTLLNMSVKSSSLRTLFTWFFRTLWHRWFFNDLAVIEPLPLNVLTYWPSTSIVFQWFFYFGV